MLNVCFYFFVCSFFLSHSKFSHSYRRLRTIVFYVSFLKKKRVLYIIFIVTINSILTQLNVKEKGVQSLNINNPFLFYLQNPQFISTKMFSVLWPMTLRLDHMWPQILQNIELVFRQKYFSYDILYLRNKDNSYT